MRSNGPSGNDRRILSWQERWQGLADALERAMENRAYRLLMCVATVGLVLVYVVVGTRSVEPTLWPQNRWVEFRESDSVGKFDYRKWERVERAVRNIEKLHRALSVRSRWRPSPIQLDISYFLAGDALAPDSFAIEAHVLRLWMDEMRGQPALGVFDVATEVVVRAILWEVLPGSKNDLSGDPSGDRSGAESQTWLDATRTIAESCRLREQDRFGKLPWWELCRSKSTSELERANPMSLVNWLAGRLSTRLKELGPLERLTSLHALMVRATSASAMRLERAQAWPEAAVEFGSNLLALEEMFEAKGLVGGPTPIREFQRLTMLSELDARTEIRLAVVTSCVFPQMQQFLKFRARELVWVQTCDDNEKLKAAKTAEEFARKNPHVLMAKIGLEETRLALERGWLKGDTRVTEIRDLDRGNSLHRNLQAQHEEWRPDLQVLKLRAPVDVLQFVRPLKN